MQGLSVADGLLQKGATTIAQASTSAGGDVVSGMVALIQARSQQAESVAAIRTSSQMQKTLLDLFA